MASVAELKKSFFAEIDKVENREDLEKLRVKYLGREKGILTAVLRSLGGMPLAKRKELGPQAQELKRETPTVSEQMALDGSFTADFFASRFLLRKGRAYQAAVEALSPYSEVKDVNPEARDAIKSLAQRSSRRPSFIFVNNRLEGNALKTISEALMNEDELS